MLRENPCTSPIFIDKTTPYSNMSLATVLSNAAFGASAQTGGNESKSNKASYVEIESVSWSLQSLIAQTKLSQTMVVFGFKKIPLSC